MGNTVSSNVTHESELCMICIAAINLPLINQVYQIESILFIVIHLCIFYIMYTMHDNFIKSFIGFFEQI